MADPGEGPGEAAAPPMFRPNWGPKGRKIFFDTPPPLSQGLDDQGPLIWRSGSATAQYLARENSRLASVLAARDVSPWETSAPQRQKFHSDDVKSVQNLARSSD